VGGDVGSELYAKRRKGVFRYFHLHISKLEWFYGKHIKVDGNINKFSQGPYSSVADP
jgi:hypothetical protein